MTKSILMLFYGKHNLQKCITNWSPCLSILEHFSQKPAIMNTFNTAV